MRSIERRQARERKGEGKGEGKREGGVRVSADSAGDHGVAPSAGAVGRALTA